MPSSRFREISDPKSPGSATAVASLTEVAVFEAREEVEQNLRGSFMEELRARTDLEASEIVRRAGRPEHEIEEAKKRTPYVRCRRPVSGVFGNMMASPSAIASVPDTESLMANERSSPSCAPSPSWSCWAMWPARVWRRECLPP